MRKKQRHKYKNTPKIEIETNGIHTHITVDGKELRGVRQLRFEADPSSIPTIWIEMNALNMKLRSSVPLPIINQNKDIEYLRCFAASIDMLWAIESDRDFFIKDGSVWVRDSDGTEKIFDDRVEQFVALRNMVCSFVPNVEFRSAEYIGYRDKDGKLYESEV